MKHYLFFLGIIIFLSGCPVFKPVEPVEPEDIEVELAFSIEAKCDSLIYSHFIVGKTLYYLECDPYFGDDEYTHVLSYDLEKGKLNWKKNIFSDMPDWQDSYAYCNMCYSDGFLWIPLTHNGEDYIASVDSTSGERKSIIALGDGNLIDCGQLVSSNGNIYFALLDKGVYSFYTQSLVPPSAGEEFYTVTLASVWPYSIDDCFTHTIKIIDEDLVLKYANSENLHVDDGLVRIDLDTNTEVWDINTRFLWNFSLLEDSIYISGGSVRGEENIGKGVLFDWETGTFQQEVFFDNDTQSSPQLIGNRIIQVVPKGIGWQNVPYMICYQYPEMTKLWEVTTSSGDGVYSGSNGQEYDGIYYRPSYTGVWLYDMDNGNVLGIDNSIQANALGDYVNTTRYNDLLIVQTGTHILGIKMNFTKGLFGGLQKN